MNTDKVGINDRILVVKYPTWEQTVDRLKHITEVISKDLEDMGNEQKIHSIFLGEKNGQYQIVFTLKPTK